MFTGIVEESAEVAGIIQQPESIRLRVRAALCGEGARIGDSIAVNGCCLTVAGLSGAPSPGLLEFDLLRETWNRTNLQFVQPGSAVNLERALSANGRLHGHFVTGHVDGTGRIEIFEPRGADWFLRIACPAEILRYLVFKGSIAVDGISLTVAEVDARGFAVWIIPHTRKITALRQRQAGDAVNLEADLLAKYAEKFLAPPAARA